MSHRLPIDIEYLIVGAGPAGICAIARILNEGVTAKKIIWIDPHFKVGDFGNKLSQGTSVPGNTSVQSYQYVVSEIKKIFSLKIPSELDRLSPDFVCSLKVAAVPLQAISNHLHNLVTPIQGEVTEIKSSLKGYDVYIKSNEQILQVNAKRVVLAVGATPKKFTFLNSDNHLSIIPLDVALIESELEKYLHTQASFSKIAVIGSSHSAALAVMHLLKAGIQVKQFMSKAYKYAEPAITDNGEHYIKFDNTGLKGEVAKFTKELLDNPEHQYHNNLKQYIGVDKADVNSLLTTHVNDCSHFVVAIGYEPLNHVTVDSIPLANLRFNSVTTQFVDFKGLFGIGIAFPQTVKAYSGEVEAAVGVAKFWNTLKNPQIFKTWDDL